MRYIWLNIVLNLYLIVKKNIINIMNKNKSKLDIAYVSGHI
jgi:hypothetical protein